MDILITGGTGFVGSHLLYRLITNKENNISLIKRIDSDIWRIKDIVTRINIYNFRSSEDLQQILSKHHFDIIVHLATKYIKEEKNIQDIEEMNFANITFPSILLDLAIKYKVKAFINTGTLFEYKLSNQKITEKQPLEPYNYYAATKVAFENILKYYSDKKKINAMTLKLFYPYGEKDNKKIIPLIIDSLIKKQLLNITFGEQRLNFTYVDDIIDAYIKSMELAVTDKYFSYKGINIGNEEAYSIKEIVAHLEKISKNIGTILFNRPYPKNEIMHMCCDASKARKTLNWAPKTNIRDGLKRTYSYYSQNRI